MFQWLSNLFFTQKTDCLLIKIYFISNPHPNFQSFENHYITYLNRPKFLPYY
jgi:hypothetical protein